MSHVLTTKYYITLDFLFFVLKDFRSISEQHSWTLSWMNVIQESAPFASEPVFFASGKTLRKNIGHVQAVLDLGHVCECLSLVFLVRSSFAAIISDFEKF